MPDIHWMRSAHINQKDIFLGEKLITHEGLEKILFGSDGFVPEQIEMTINYFDNKDFLTNEEIEKILGLNAAKLLNL